MREDFSHIMERWFIQEPPMFQVLSIHELTPNIRMECPLRSGGRKLEYNPNLISKLTLNSLEQLIRVEAIRILLKHPYERKPRHCSGSVIALASNIVIGDNYNHPGLKMEKPEDFGLEKGMNYEWYAMQLKENQPTSSEDADVEKDDAEEEEGLSKYKDLSGLWEEDDFTLQEINGIISRTEQWGSLTGNMAEILGNSLKAKVNWHNVLAGFRASVISSARKLTRMKPNRRTGFDNMGSTMQYKTRLLVAVDVSGSIPTKDIQYFYGVINSAFRYGFQTIDVIQFDCGITGMQTLKRVKKNITVTGRGGTSFQEPVDYAHQQKYDGLVILTDGCAPEPVIPQGFKTKILWVLNNNISSPKLKKTGRVCTMQI